MWGTGTSSADDLAYVDKRPPQITAWRWPATIEFEDGERQMVLLRRTPTLIGQVSDSLAQEYPAMRAAVEAGNYDAAFGLYKALAACRISPRNDLELSLAIQALHSDGALRVLAVPGGETVVKLPIEQRADAEAGLRQQASNCRGLSPSQLDEADDWLQVALDHGVPWARLEVAQRMKLDEMRSTAGLQAWEAAWRAGSIIALSWIGEIQRSEWRSEPEHRPDPVAGYAYRYLFTKLKRAKADATGNRLAEGHADYLEKALRQEASRLSAGERERAATLARNILASSETCCYLD